ncbi:hypothetical protein ACFLX2_00985 [Candidatus Dependentiae bacterium]
MKKAILSAAAVAFIYSSQGVAEDYFILTSPILSLIDGKSFAINGEVFGLLLQMRREIRKRIFGVRTDSGQYIGMYDFDGEKKSMIELEMLETRLEATYYAKLEKLQECRDRYTEKEFAIEVNEIERDYKEKKQKLRTVLEFVKDDFLEISKVYADSIRSFKSQILKLIQESAERRDNPDCSLLVWADENLEDEGTYVKEELITFKDFKRFCVELTEFLGDMARSCAKAKKLFIDMIKKSKAKR